MIDQGELFDISNPCRGICQVNNKGYCKGCFRSRAERFHWNQYSPFQQQLIANACERRRLRIIATKNQTPQQVDIEQEDSSAQLNMFSDEQVQNKQRKDEQRKEDTDVIQNNLAEKNQPTDNKQAQPDSEGNNKSEYIESATKATKNLHSLSKDNTSAEKEKSRSNNKARHKTLSDPQQSQLF